MYPNVSSSLTGRETAGAGISNVAGYSSLTDSRFARADNNASPVPSTLSQQVMHYNIIYVMFNVIEFILLMFTCFFTILILKHVYANKT